MEHPPAAMLASAKLVLIPYQTAGNFIMATPSKPIILKITDAGKLGALNPTGDAVNLLVNLTHVAIGSGRYTPTGEETKIKTFIAKTVTASGDIDAATNTLQFSATIYADKITPVYELGLLTETDALFAIASALNEPLFTLYPNVAFVVAFGMSLNEASNDKVTVMLNSSASLMPAIMQNHLAAPNPHPQYLGSGHLDVTSDPHPQYLDLKRFQLLLEVLIPIGYLHHTHSAINPKVDFDKLLGINTAWRRLLGKTIVATDPADPYIKDAGITLGQKGVVTPAHENRPHTYPIHTTNIFERYNPDEVIETVWSVIADKIAINEGAAIRFTVSANNVPDGQILEWTAKEGALNAASNDITNPDKNVTGTVILKNGAAVIDFVTSADENMAEAQKHVRLTIAAPANISINIPVLDAGRTEKIVHITRSTLNGIVLDEYYKLQSGAYPLPTDKIRFVINEFVDVIASDTLSAAITDGIHWPAGSQIIVENRGRILGRGGDGGLAATAYKRNLSPAHFDYITTPAEQGSNGGTAIKGAIEVENYGLIAGGGGGGGGAGYFKYSEYGDGYSGGAGGGAPLGRRYPNPQSYEEYLEIFNAPSKYTLPPLKNPTTGLTYDNYNELCIIGSFAEYGSYIRGEIFSGQPIKSDIIRIDGYPHPLSSMRASFYIPDYLDANKTDYRVWSWGGGRGWVNGLRQSTSATLENKGMGGLSLHSAGDNGALRLLEISKIDGLDISKNKGGDGGGIGEDGRQSLLGEFYAVIEESLMPFKVSKSDLVLIHEPADGGLAGFVKEGAVVINNFAAGTTKGR